MINLIQNIVGIDISIYNDLFLEKTINSRIKDSNSTDIEDYIDCLKACQTEKEKFKQSLYNNFSEFFRDTFSFAYLEHQILPKIINNKLQNDSKEIRMWSAACSGGYEAYSLAILCDEFKKQQAKELSIRIFATDISEQEIRIAQKGIYQEHSLRNIQFGRIKKYFLQRGDKYLINPELKQDIDFSTFDLLNKEFDCPSSSVFGNFDVIFCSNILYYYKPEIQKVILSKLDRSLTKNGYLVVSEAEVKIVETHNYYKRIKNVPILQKV